MILCREQTIFVVDFTIFCYNPGMTLTKFRITAIFCILAWLCPVAAANTPNGTQADSLYASAREKYARGEQADALDDLLEMLKSDQVRHGSYDPEEQSRACLMAGNINLGYNDHIDAAKFYEQGLELTTDPGQQMKFLYNLSIAYCLMGNEPMARDYCRRLADIKVENRGLHLYDIAVSEATIEKSFGNRMRSVTLFKHAIALSDSFRLNRGKYHISPLSEIAQYYDEYNRLDSALVWFTIYENAALESHYPHAVADCYRGLMRTYIKTGDQQKALEYSSLYLASMDSLVNFNRFVYVSSKHERQREQADASHIENLEFTVSRQKLLLGGFFIIILCAALIWGVIRIMRGNRKSLFDRNRELALLEEEFIRKENNGPSPCNDTGQWDELMQRVTHEISRPVNFCNPDFSINTLATICGSNTRYISQAINETTNDNFRALLNGYRIREARRRLTSDPLFSNRTLQSIGESVGFRSASNFINAFKKVTGMTPSLYQRMAKDKQG